MLVSESEGSIVAVRFNSRELRVIKELGKFQLSSLRIQRCTSMTKLLTVQAQPCRRVGAVATSGGKHPSWKASVPAKVS